MKNFIFSTLKWTSVAFLFVGLIAVTGCSDDESSEDDDTPTELVEDGFYIQGDATQYSGFSIDATLSKARNEVLNNETEEPRDELFEAFVAVRGTGGFNIVQVAGSDRTTWGPGEDFADVTQGTTDEPKVTFQRGSLAVTETQFSVPGDGLYHVVIDVEVAKVAIIPVEYWGVIGAATPGGWSDDTKLEPTGFDFNEITFEATEVTMTKADFKFRYSGGWKVEIDTTYDNGGALDKGIKVNTNFGGSVADLVPGGANIANDEGGIYTISMVWRAGEGYTATLTKTADLPATDWSDIELGLVGDGLNDMGAQHNWDVTLYVQKPTVNGNVFTYTYPGVSVNTAGGGFKVREGQTWDNVSFGFNEVTLDGDGAADFETNNDGNFVPLEDGAEYDVTLVIDGVTDDRTMTFTKL